MFTIQYSFKRITSVLEEIDRLKQSEFPYKSSKEALDILERKFKDHQKVLNNIKKSPPTLFVANNACSISLTDIYLYLPILGFILRSTSVRNAFETYGPLLRLSREILGSSSKLILSSEWENAPFIYSEISILPNFVLIGLPAQESENPLLIPLSGHELGHSMWIENKIASDYTTIVEDKIITKISTNYWRKYKNIYPQAKKETLRDLSARSTWILAYEFAIRQTEEIFCDFLGLKIFAESYLFAISYLISPRISGLRSLYYPNTTHRIAYLIEAAKEFNINIPSEFQDSFEDMDEPNDPTVKLLVELADDTSSSLVNDIIKKIGHISEEKKIPERSHEKVLKSKKNIENLVPISNAKSLTDILNAAWLCFHDENLWKKVPIITLQNKYRVLNELILKSIEVYEIEQRLR